ncbi:hypothetical protein BJP36_38475 [Moorena producens JHB]|uniref:Uncharacterized protein n=1 Tax=Moorena producens (strain JHB) TaxID=1454205 RepID=A0A9Q9UWJ8_MOOP1|nr:hypothetical protein [Moorena producens]WAN69966.1 hypothetical protein BJP36_38475 [Moorena producens JHB]
MHSCLLPSALLSALSITIQPDMILPLTSYDFTTPYSLLPTPCSLKTCTSPN